MKVNFNLLPNFFVSQETRRQMVLALRVDSYLMKWHIAMGGLSDEHRHWLRMMIFDVATIEAQRTTASVDQWLDHICTKIDECIMAGDGWQELLLFIDTYRQSVQGLNIRALELPTRLD